MLAILPAQSSHWVKNAFCIRLFLLSELVALGRFCFQTCRNMKFRDIMLLLSNRYPTTGGGVRMEIVTAFLVAVAAGVACHYIIKWLDSDRKDNE